MASNPRSLPLTQETVATLTVVQLRQELAKRELSVSGLKSVLIQRLEEALEKEVQVDPEANIPRTDEEQREEMSDTSEDERGYKRKRIHDTEVSEPTSPDYSLVLLSQELKASHKERERLQFQLEEASEKVATAKQEGKREAYQEQQKEMAEMRGMLDVALRKREELEFKLAQKDDELRESSTTKQSERQDPQHLKALKEEVKKRETLAFQCEQLKEQLTEYKQQVRVLQQKIETNQIHTEREKKETSRSLLEERGKAQSIRVRMESQRDELIKEWRVEFDKQIEREQEELNHQLRETKRLQKELKEKTAVLEGQMAEKLKRELQRLADMQADLFDKENQLRENDKLQEELDVALEQRQRSIDDEAARLESDKQEFEEKLQSFEKERQEFEERLWVVDRDVKRRRDKEKELDDQIMELLAKNESLVAEHAHTKDALSRQMKALTIENENLKNALALSQARVVSARGGPTVQPPRQEEIKEEAPAAEQSTQESGRLTRSQSQLMRSQEQQTREILLKTKSRPSFIPKPSARKIDVTLLAKPTTTTNSNKENTRNNSAAEGDPEPSTAAQARKQRSSMIPIRKGSSLLPPQIKALRS